jgi:hypothetical protein
MTKFNFIGAASTLFMEADVTMVHTTETEAFADVQARWLAENGLAAIDLRSETWNGDDSGAHITDIEVTPKYKIPMLKNFAISTEGQFGFMALPLVGASQGVTHPKGRAYSSNPTPPILFSMSFTGQDSGAFNSQLWSKPGVALFKWRNSHYGGSNPALDILMLVKQDKFVIYARRVDASGSWPMRAATYSHTANTTTPVNNYDLGPLFATGNNTLVTIKYGGAYHPAGSWESAAEPLDNLDQVVSNAVTWTEDLPAGTSAVVEAKVNNGAWATIANGGALADIAEDLPLTDSTVSFKVTLTSTNPEVTPRISNLKLLVTGYRPPVDLELRIDPLQRFHNNEGPIKVKYAQNLGTLVGEGGSVETFEVEFTPTQLVPNPNPEITDLARMTPTAKVTYFQVTYKKGYSPGLSKAGVTPAVKVIFTPVAIVNP